MSADKISKVVYAQSSDIKSRTYLEYRKDMKKKAIAELEIIEWFENVLKKKYASEEVTVEKSGWDSTIWFSRDGKISGEPDYTARIKGSEHKFEFQYADKDDLQYYDFKISKVGKLKKGVRIPHSDREFLYILKQSNKFAIFTPQWVNDNGKVDGVPAWGNRTAFRVPAKIFKELFVKSKKLAEETVRINQKNNLLDIQSNFVDREDEILSHDLQKIVDENKKFKIIPKTLNGFYRSCFLMEKIQKYPKNNSLWLVYGTGFYSNELNSYELSKLVYSLDFLYGGSRAIEDNVLRILVDTLKKISDHLQFTPQPDYPVEDAVVGALCRCIWRWGKKYQIIYNQYKMLIFILALISLQKVK